MMSFISMHKNNWQQHSYAAACSVSDLVLFQCMKDSNIDKVYLCLDNDDAGQTANRRIAAKLEEQGVEYDVLVPTLKDWKILPLVPFQWKLKAGSLLSTFPLNWLKLYEPRWWA